MAQAGIASAALAVVLVSDSASAQTFWRSGWNPYSPYGISVRPFFGDMRGAPARRSGKIYTLPKETKKSKVAVQGPLQVIVSLSDQRIVVYDNGVAIARAPISSGRASHPTPTGVFSIIQKSKYHRSNLYDDAPMPYMQRLTWSGVALHQGALPGYPASHGCIRLPMDFAQKLWSMTRIGARVIVAKEMVAPTEIAHPKLLQTKPLALRSTIFETASTSGAIARAGSMTLAAADTTASDAAAAESATEATQIIGVAAQGQTLELALSETPPANKSPQSGAITVFISRAEGRLFIRKDFQTIYETSVTFREPDAPIGTHVATAMNPADGDGNLRWSVMTMPEGRHSTPAARGKSRKSAAAQPSHSTDAAAKAFDRVEIPQEALDKIGELVTPGATMIVSDHRRSAETGKGTDFIVLTR